MKSSQAVMNVRLELPDNKRWMDVCACRNTFKENQALAIDAEYGIWAAQVLVITAPLTNLKASSLEP